MVMELFDCSSPHDVTISAASQSTLLDRIEECLQERGRYPLQHFSIAYIFASFRDCFRDCERRDCYTDFNVVVMVMALFDCSQHHDVTISIAS